MVSESGFHGGQESSSPVTPMSLVMNRLLRFRDGFTSPQEDNSPVTSPTRIRSFSEAPARTSSNEPPSLNDEVTPMLSNQQKKCTTSSNADDVIR